MRIKIVAVGRLKERFWSDAQSEYLKRLKPYADVQIAEVADRDSSRIGIDRALVNEGADIDKALPQGAYTIALDIQGRQVSSEEFAALIDNLGVSGRSSVAFVVGGSHGISPALLRQVDERLSLGRVTLPHNLARVVLLEQVYRAFRILRGEPYHK